MKVLICGEEFIKISLSSSKQVKVVSCSKK